MIIVLVGLRFNSKHLKLFAPSFRLLYFLSFLCPNCGGRYLQKTCSIIQVRLFSIIQGSATHLEAIDAEIAALLDEARTSYATHNRKLKELSLLRAKSSSSVFFSAFSRTLTPLFDFQRHLASVERVVSFVSALAASASDEFIDCFLKFLLAAATTSSKTTRFRACQIVSESDTEVKNAYNFKIYDCTEDLTALSRFVNDSVNSDILDLYLEVLPFGT
ncbi:hypothetical protein LR48_Vigan01g234200 [Vigna angularis]|uniref:Uncharacterized protein n=1 Tax=Phaseolus angularis TaxID=3914 RepID=A0A0L9TQM3_PHAAN|nr:hypothetical protein LR48_Vigan01g234200 [Vigna angularis]